ncbi:hypothetical protein HGA64_03460 [Candidatus Falkowbacteria bacterium]|nr:hypothetical protein [Candidatus Falkowbacteria bacterium]
MKSLAKEASKPAEYLLFNYGGVDLKLEVKSFCSTSKRKGGKTKIRTLKYVAVTSPSYLLLCDKCKAKIYPGSTCYHVINKKGKLDTASHCTILCMKEKFGELKKT